MFLLSPSGHRNRLNGGRIGKGAESCRKLHKAAAKQTKDRGVLCLSGWCLNKGQMRRRGLARLQGTFSSMPLCATQRFSSRGPQPVAVGPFFFCAEPAGLGAEAALTSCTIITLTEWPPPDIQGHHLFIFLLKFLKFT